MHNHFVIQAFTGRLFVMVVENGRQNRLHLGELLTEPLALRFKGDRGEKGRRESA